MAFSKSFLWGGATAANQYEGTQHGGRDHGRLSHGSPYDHMEKTENRGDGQDRNGLWL